MDSESSSESFLSTDDDFSQEVETAFVNNEINKESTVPEIQTNEISAANLGKNLNSQTDEFSGKDENILDTKITIKWDRITVVIAFTALFALLSMFYRINNGELQPELIFRHNPFSFIMFLMILMTAFFFAINGVIFSGKFPTISRAFGLVALTSVILSFTVLLWSFLPPELSWVPWICFAFTCGSLLHLCGQHAERKLEGTDDV